jgi:chloride channel protein, CIC family
MTLVAPRETRDAEPTTGFLLPAVLRAFVRNRETGVALAGVVIGIMSGLLVAIIGTLSEFAHRLLFDLPPEAHLSATGVISWQRLLFVPIAGGVVLAAISIWFRRRLKGQLADAIEANALYGGRMSMRGSIFISVQTLLSNGFGGSVGLEAGYTQICSAIASYFGRMLAARRNDMRLLVACGAAGAISAAFSAPLAGAFYAFEVVLGAYTSASLVSVVAAAVCGWFVARQLTHQAFLMVPGFPTPVSIEMIAQSVLIGVICAAVSIALMLSVAYVERAFKAVRFIGAPFRPIIGGALLGGMALLTPVVLGAGHGAMQLLLVSNPTWILLTTTIILKMAASAVSLGSGFRGGLFFASLLLGALIGELYSVIATIVMPGVALQPGTAAIAALAAFGAGVIGAPFSMVCLALEITGDFSVTVGAIVASSVTALIVRELFGYSFATWRFHLRGEVIRGPQDVGWTRQFKASVLMRSDIEIAPTSMPIAEAQTAFAPGTKQIVLRDDGGRYAGLVFVGDLHAVANTPDQTVQSIARQQGEYLLPYMTIRDIIRVFEQTETDVLVVVETTRSMIPLGTISEAYVLRTYGEELERRNEEMFSR